MATKAKRKPLVPRLARTEKQICDLPRTSIECGNFWIQFDEFTVTIAEQKPGVQPSQHITIPRREAFDKFVDWYQGGKPSP